MSSALALATAAHHIAAPHIDWKLLSPLVVLTAGGLVALLVGLLRARVVREVIVPVVAVLTFLCLIAASIVVFNYHPSVPRTGHAFCVVDASGCAEAPLAIDRLALELYMLFGVAGLATVLMSWRGIAVREAGQVEFTVRIPIEAAKDVKVERGGYALRVVVGGQ